MSEAQWQGAAFVVVSARLQPLQITLFLLFRQCVDLSCNELSEITLPENLPPKLQELDLTGNPRLALDHKSLELLK